MVKVNDLALFERLGVVGKDPKGAVAYKVSASDVAVTRLRGIDVQVGRTGALTPVAVLDAGAHRGRHRHQRHPAQRRPDRGPRPAPGGLGAPGAGRGGHPRRAGGRPGRGPAGRDGDALGLPHRLPRLRRPGGAGTPTRGHAPAAPAPPARPRWSARIRHYVGRGAVDIAGLGANWVERFLAEGFISTAADLYHLTREQLLSLEGSGMGEVLADKLLAVDRRQPHAHPPGPLPLRPGHPPRGAGDGRADRPLDRLPGRPARRAARDGEGAGTGGAPDGVPYVDRLQAEILETKGLGHGGGRLASPSALRNPATLGLLDRFAAGGMRPHPRRPPAPPDGAADRPPGGEDLRPHRDPQRAPRGGRRAGSRAAGGKVTDAVSGATSYVVAGDRPGGSKLKGAAKHGVPVVDEAALRALLPAAPARTPRVAAEAAPPAGRRRPEASPAGAGRVVPARRCPAPRCSTVRDEYNSEQPRNDDER